MIIKSTVEQDYELLRFHVTYLIDQLQEQGECNNELEATADTVAEAFDALDRKLKDGDAFPNEWIKNR